MARFYRSTVDTRIDNASGHPRRVEVTNAYAFMVENAVSERNREGEGYARFDYDRWYSIASFDLEVFTDDGADVVPPAYCPITKVLSLIETGYAERTVEIALKSGVTITFEAVIGKRGINVSEPGGSAHKTSFTVQPTGAIMIAGM